jgi:hypothetical protein
MTTPELKMTDLRDLYKPGQLSDLALMMGNSLRRITTLAFSRLRQDDVRSLGNDIATLRTNTIAPGVINATGPNAALITSTVAKYAQIPTALSAFVTPPAPTDSQELAADNPVLGSVLEALSTALTDFCSTVIYNVIEDNIAVTDPARINLIRRLVLSYVDFLNNIPTRLMFSGSIMDPNFAEVSSRLSSILSTKMGVAITPPGSITPANIGVLCGGAGASPDASLRKTQGTVIGEVAVSIRLSLAAIVTAKTFDKYNTPANIAALKEIPEMLKNVATLSTDPMCVQYLTNFSTSLIPIAEPTNSLFTNLNSANFTASLSQPTTGIANYLITIVLGHLPHWLGTFMGWLGTRMIGRSFQTMAQIHQLTAKIVLVVKAYVFVLNRIISIFQISIQNDAAGLRVALMLNDITEKNGFSVNLFPTAQGGKRNKHKRSRKHRRRRARPSRRSR